MSDNGTNFVAGSEESKALVEQLETEKIKASTANRSIKWHFNPLYGLDLCGLHEIMIKSAKKPSMGYLGMMTSLMKS